MSLSQADRIAFSLAIVQADAQIAGINLAKSQVQGQMDKLQNLDTANKNLFDPVNLLINTYQSELADLNGIIRSTIVEQDILDSANKKPQNHFFPNDLNVSVPALSAFHNIWTQVSEFALTYCIGLNYTQNYPGSTAQESDLINPILTLISSASSYADIENTSGQHCTTPNGMCSLNQYVDQTNCTGNGGVWTPGVDTIDTFPAVQTLKSNLVTAVNNLIAFLNTELTHIATNDKDLANQTQNNAAINYLNNTLLPALNTWLGYSDFNTVPNTVTTCMDFYAYNSNLLAPTKLHSTQLTALQNALNNRLSFISTRVSQLNSTLGSITQNVNNGNITASSGLYGKRYDFLSLRLNALTGSLSQLVSLQNATSAQTSIAKSISQNKNTYYGIVPTSIFQAPGSGTPTISLADVSFLSPGDTVYISADNQDELQRAVKSINGKIVVLNDTIPSKYKPIANARLYKDIS